MLDFIRPIGNRVRSSKRYVGATPDASSSNSPTRRKCEAGKNAAPISPIALEAVKRIDAIFDIEREINGAAAKERLAARGSRSVPLVAALEEWMRTERATLSRHNAAAKAIDYMLTRWTAFARFLEDGRICLTNNAAERALRGLAIARSFCPCRG
jgi:transposase